jgi:hypothetical protein
VADIKLLKGEMAEEVLRDYFLEQGYFVVRGIPYKYQDVDVTDVDLWLYAKTSLLTRERINVDIKRKRTPQALERIFWTKGLQNVLNLDKCIVSTTDKRKYIREFGIKNDVTVLDGDFYNRLVSRGQFFESRITEEELFSGLSPQDSYTSCDELKRYKISKSNLLSRLDFDGINSALKDIKYWMEKSVLLRGEENKTALRMLYIVISFFLISVDYVAKDIVYLNQESRFSYLKDGFRYGKIGEDKSKEILEMAIKLSSVMSSNPNQNTLRNDFFHQYSSIDAEMLAEFFSKVAHLKLLFDHALTFEAYGYSKTIIPPSKLGVEMKSLIGLLSDFLKIERKEILEI